MASDHAHYYNNAYIFSARQRDTIQIACLSKLRLLCLPVPHILQHKIRYVFYTHCALSVYFIFFCCCCCILAYEESVIERESARGYAKNKGHAVCMSMLRMARKQRGRHRGWIMRDHDVITLWFVFGAGPPIHTIHTPAAAGPL